MVRYTLRSFPVNLEPYVPADEFEEGEDSPDFFTKIELGKKLVLDAIEKGIQFKENLIDNWYLCSDFLSFLEIQGKDWISTLKSNDVIYRVNKRRRIRKKKKHRAKKGRREFTEIVYHFSQRWRTEDFNRDANDNLAFGQYSVSSKKPKSD